MREAKNDIDWGRAHDRLRVSNQALALALEPNEATIKAVQRRRAAYLASRKRDMSENKTGLSVLVFWLRNERFAIRLEDLLEISGPMACTPVPGLMDRLLGLVNLHGEIRPVLDGAALLGVPRQGAVNRVPGAILYLRWKRRAIGLGADRLEGVQILDEDRLSPCGGEGGALPGRFIKAIAGDMLALIDAAALLAGSGVDDDMTSETQKEGRSA